VDPKVPDVGDESSTWEEVSAFYDFWYGFKSWREFPHPGELPVVMFLLQMVWFLYMRLETFSAACQPNALLLWSYCCSCPEEQRSDE
jgi:hypothetical protein